MVEKFDGYVKLGQQRYLPECSGIYFVISNDDVFYIGKSSNIRARFFNHHRADEFSKLKNVEIHWLEQKRNSLDTMERLYIEKYKPQMNNLDYLSANPEQATVLEGRFYTSQELQKLLNVSKQRIYNLSVEQNWDSAASGLYWAEDVEPYLQHYRNIDPQKLPVRTYDHPEGITWADLEKEFDEVRRIQEQD